ncbi:MAG: phosphatase PAP2 family protein [Bacteroidales bacterium]|nr:phosphatase PAP2 family protein [Bacteroidales bacterium]
MFWQEIHKTDQLLSLKINSWDSSVTDPIWQFFSNIPVWIPMYVLIVGCLIWRLGWKKGLVFVLAATATFGFCDQFSNFIKDLAGRPRPLNDPFMVEHGLNILDGTTKSFSFFSAHAANSFGLATCTYIGFRQDTRLRYRGYAWWMFFWASMVSISRVFVGKHYLGDVIVGIIVGAAAGYLFATIAKLISVRYFK